MSLFIVFLDYVTKGSALVLSVVLTLLTVDAVRSEKRNEALGRYLAGFVFLFAISLVIRGLI